MVKIWNEWKRDINSSKKKEKEKNNSELNKFVEVHSWHKQLPSEVWIEKSPADVKTISIRLGTPRLTGPTLWRNLQIKQIGTWRACLALEDFLFGIYEHCSIAHVHMPKQALCKLGKPSY